MDTTREKLDDTLRTLDARTRAHEAREEAHEPLSGAAASSWTEKQWSLMKDAYLAFELYADARLAEAGIDVTERHSGGECLTLKSKDRTAKAVVVFEVTDSCGEVMLPWFRLERRVTVDDEGATYSWTEETYSGTMTDVSDVDTILEHVGVPSCD